VVDRFEAQVERFGERTASEADIQAAPGSMPHDWSSRNWTYTDLNRHANQLAHAILAHSDPRLELAMVFASLRDPYLPAMLGILKAGKGFVVVDPDEPSAQIQEKLSISGVDTVITGARHVAQLAPCLSPAHKLLVMEEIATHPQPDNPGLTIDPSQLFSVYFTSGSTGKPKGVMRSHRQALHATFANTGLGYMAASDRTAIGHSPSFGTAMHPNLGAILNGGTVCPIDPRLQSVAAVWKKLAAKNVTVIYLPLAYLRELVLIENVPPLPNLRLVRVGGQVLYGVDVAALQRRLHPEIVIHYAYGATETTTAAVALIDRNVTLGPGPLPVGYPTSDTEFFVVDEQHNRLGDGETGELVINSRYHSPGYWRDEVRTQAKFAPAPGESGRRLLYTGDHGLIHPDGCIELRGRADDMVKVRGYRVEPNAIEGRLRQHPALSDVVVIARPQPDGELMLVAYVVAKANSQVDTQATPANGHSLPSPTELHAFVGATLPHYMIPARFIVLDRIAKLPNGKVNRHALPPPGRTRPPLTVPFAAPQTLLEQQTADLWADILDLDQVGMDDNLKELGASSLQLARGVTRVAQLTAATVDLSRWLPAPTLRHLLNTLETSGEPVRTTIPAASEPRLTKHTGIKGFATRMAKTGPLLGPLSLPYGSGASLLRRLLDIPPIFAKLTTTMTRELHAVHHLIGQEAPDDATLRTFLYANLWTRWRLHALTHTRAQQRWITWQGVAHLEAARLQHKPVVFVFVHTALRNQLAKARSEQHLGTLYTPEITAAAKGANREAQILQTVQDAHQHLAQGHSVFIAGDGLVGRTTYAVPFFGQTFHMPIGFADLAAAHEAWLIPTLSTVALDGRVTVEYGAPLLATGSHAARVDSLCIQYADYLRQRWQQIMPQILMHNLGRFFSVAAGPSALSAQSDEDAVA
jgi:amino acid adenylation domain-containing protein